MTSVGGIVLAAGAGSRFGGPKALALTGARPWVALAVDLLRAAGLEPIRVVIGAAAAEVRAAVPPGADVIENPDWAAGRTGSLQQGLRDLPPAVRAVLVHQVDFPEVRVETVTALVRRFGAEAQDGGGDAESRIYLPIHDGRRGHPILLGRALWPEVERLRPDEPLRTVVHRDPARQVEVAVEDPGIHANRNRPGDDV